MLGALLRWLAFFVLVSGLNVPALTQGRSPGIAQEGLNQIAAMIAEKRSRTPEEAKLDSNLLFGMRAVVARRTRQIKPQPLFVDAFVSETCRSE
jgi:hypothetical protein